MRLRFYDWLCRKMFNRHVWRPAPGHKVRVDALPVEQFRYQREALADRLRQIHEVS